MKIKKLISVMLVAAVVFGAAPLAGLVGLDLPEFNLFSTKAEAAASGKCGENLDWIFYDSTGELHIGGTGEMTDWTGINSVPWKSYRSSIKSVKIYDDVKNIGSNAFDNCSNLESVIIGKAVESIGINVFTNCSKLEDITVDSDNTVYSSLDGVLFNEEKTVLIKCPAGNSRTSYAVPDSVKKIDNFSFQSCGKLESITIPYGVAAIGDGAFQLCGKLKAVTIPDSVTIIGKNAFSFCKALENITLSKGLTAIGNYTFGYCEALEDVVIPDGVTEIEANAFIYCFELKSIAIPRSVKTVGGNAFSSDSKIADVYYGGTQAEWNEISFGEGNGFLTRSSNNFVWNHVVAEETTTAPTTTQPSTTVPSTTKPAETTTRPTTTAPTTTRPTTTVPTTTAPSTTAPTTTRPTTTKPEKTTTNPTTTVPPSTTDHESLIYSGFCGVNITWMLDTATGELLISGTGAMTDWESSEYAPWSKCRSSVEKIIISDGVTSIGSSSFEYCVKLVSVIIPASVTNIGDSAFYWCNRLEDIYYAGTEEEWDAIKIGSDNNPLIYETIHFDYITEENTTNPGDLPSKPEAILQIRKPSAIGLSYSDSIVLHADIRGVIPQGSRIVWTADNGNFTCDVSADGMTCKISPVKSGVTIFTASLVDASGNVICSDEQRMNAGADFFDKIIGFLKKLFGLTRTIPEFYKGIF